MMGLRAWAIALCSRLLANPPKAPLVPCGSCGAGNEPTRTQCRNCQAAL